MYVLLYFVDYLHPDVDVNTFWDVENSNVPNWGIYAYNMPEPDDPESEERFEIAIIEQFCDIASRQLGYEDIKHYLQHNGTDTWKDLDYMEEFKGKHQVTGGVYYGAWVLFYKDSELQEKWLEALNLFKKGKTSVET